MIIIIMKEHLILDAYDIKIHSWQRGKEDKTNSRCFLFFYRGNPMRI